jgi:uncharacterized protein (TIGR03545 family)
MSRLIRWKGLVGFFVVLALIFVLFYFFAESMIKTAIEKGAGYTLGAEVNVASVELNYSPLILTINGLQATDAEQPTHNLFSFDTASAGVDVWQYLLGKTIVEQLSIEQLTFMSKRAQVGEVYQQKSADENTSKSTKSILPSLDLSLPDIDTLLDNSNLQTVKSAQQLEKTYQQERKKLLALKEQLPNKEKLKDYQAQIKALGKTKIKSLADIEKVKAEFDQIKKQFKADQQIVKKAKQQLSITQALLKKQILALKAAPAKDWQFIEKEYQLDKVNTEDFAHILFGEQAREYYQIAEMIYQRVQPLLANDDEKSQQQQQKLFGVKGRFIHFTDDNPLPEFLVKKATISMVLEQGDFVINAEELTHQHWFRNKASNITFNSKNLLGIGLFDAEINFKRAPNSDFESQGSWAVKQLQLSNKILRKTSKMELTLASGNVAGQGDYNFLNTADTSNITSVNHFALAKAKFVGSADSYFGNVVVDTIKSLNNLTVDVSAVGEINEPELSISSSLDKALKNAFSQQVEEKLAEFKQKVNSGLNEKLNKALKVNNSKNTEMLDFEALLTDTDGALKQLESSDVVKQQKKKLKKKAEDKLMKKLGDFFGG